jgi:hypothetical protein
MREAVGSRNRNMALVIVRAADGLWDTLGGNNHTVAAAMTHHNWSPAPAGGKQGDKRASTACSKSRPPFNQDVFSFQNPCNCVCKYHNYCQSLQVCKTLQLAGKLKSR